MDAWKQVHEITRANTRRWEVRRDIEVTALGVDRGVQLRLGTDSPKLTRPGTPLRDPIKVTNRNVGTMRELAAVLIAACDYVEAVNPTWASHLVHLQTPDDFLKED